MANVKKEALRQAEKIYNTISKRTPFGHWYGIDNVSLDDDNSEFGLHLSAVDDSKAKDEILADIIRIFNLPL
jgi:hypothetical protein